MNTTTRTALRTVMATTVLAGVVAVPTAAFASDGSPAPGTAGGGSARPTADVQKEEKDEKGEKKAGPSRTVTLRDGKYAVITKLTDGSYKAVVTGPDGFVFGTLTASSPSVTLDGGLKVTLDRKTGRITQTTVRSGNGEAARDTGTAKTDAKKDTKADVKTDGGKKLPKGGVAAGEAPASRPDTDPGLVGGALAAAGVLGGAGLLAARRRKGSES
ncbi:hypothetical protein SMD11_3747 [Streptomyces albireticuli]|uniref:Gram-positive cocci surface proteins LPxTG domain-containing protein n=1 Tax=Streptomyces albireticuli TaxID=1940 RepID=A0A1Z2L512_9ACTN|nr:hypothetical protein [Streptomyces albireticuli]ARZ69366.1 hypothetical protein SMD11_3747 [Streptomyces albireticuli]